MLGACKSTVFSEVLVSVLGLRHRGGPKPGWPHHPDAELCASTQPLSASSAILNTQPKSSTNMAKGTESAAIVAGTLKDRANTHKHRAQGSRTAQKRDIRIAWDHHGTIRGSTICIEGLEKDSPGLILGS